MTTRRKMFEDSQKIYYASQTAGLLIQHFKDYAGVDEEASGSGALDSRIAGHLMHCLNQTGIYTHFVRRLNMREILVQEAGSLPVSVVSHTVVSADLAARFGMQEGTALARPLLEFYYHPPRQTEQPTLVGEDHIRGFGWIAEDELQDMISHTLRAHDFLAGLFMAAELCLCEVHLKFGRFFDPVTESSRIVIVDGPTLEAFCLKYMGSNTYISTLSLCKEAELSVKTKKLIGQKLGLLSTQETTEYIAPWFRMFRKGPRVL
jgi:phosphoribosylaminoimidazole-succinocarboxamide synthase